MAIINILVALQCNICTLWAVGTQTYNYCGINITTHIDQFGGIKGKWHICFDSWLQQHLWMLTAQIIFMRNGSLLGSSRPCEAFESNTFSSTSIRFLMCYMRVKCQRAVLSSLHRLNLSSMFVQSQLPSLGFRFHLRHVFSSWNPLDAKHVNI